MRRTSAVNSTSARVASIGENSTSSQSDLAWATAARARPLTSSRVDCRWGSVWGVGGVRAGEPGDHGAVDLAGDRLHGLEVARRGDREAGFDDVDAQARELVGDLELLLRVERDAGRLLAVAQRRVEDDDPVGVVRRGHAMGSS